MKNNNIKTKKINNENINNAPLPNEDNVKNNNNIITDNSITIKKDKIDEIKIKTKNTNYYFSEEFLINTFNEIIKEEKENKKLNIPIEKKEITKLKEIIIPKIQRNIPKNEIKSKDDLKKEIKKELTTEIKKQQLKKEIYSIAKPLKKEIELPKTNKISKQNNKVKVIEKNESKIIKEKIKETPIIMVPLTKETPKIKLKDETINLVTASSLVAANLIKEVIETPNKKEEEKFKKELEKIKEKENVEKFITKTEEKMLNNSDKEVNKNPENINIDIKLPMLNNLSEKKADLNLQKEKQTIPKNESKPSNEIILENIIIKTIEPKLQTIKTIDDDKNKIEVKEQKINENKKTESPPKINNEKEEKIEQPAKISDSLLNKINQTIIISKEEMKKEELEEKKYDEVNNKINELLYDLEIYIIQNEKKLTPKQLQILKAEERKLQNAKQNINVQKKLDIQKEQKNLDELITYEELQNLQLELQKLHLENQLDINNCLLNKIEDIEKLNALQIEEIEKKLIKQKLKKASRAMEIPSILALPFIRNKYFFFFTIGLFVNNHFNFLHHIFKRKTKNYTPIDLTTLRNGQDALNNALNLTAENIMYLEYLEQEALSKYPDLATDEEYLKYINKLKTSLNKNYQKLQRKHIVLNKYCKKANKHIKILKRDERKQSA